MTTRSLILPANYDDFAWEVESKGYFGDAALDFSGQTYRLNFYDPFRLRQEIESGHEQGRVFYEPNLLVIRKVTRRNMEEAIAQLIDSGLAGSLTAED